MAINFPSNPVINDTVIVGIDTWFWNGITWEVKPVTLESKAEMFTNPVFTGTVTGVTAVMVGLGNVTNESKATMFASPTFTGTVNGITKIMVGLDNVTNESKATMFASPTFTGTVTSDSITTNNVTASGNISISNTPTSTAHAANKKYVDARSVAMSIALS